MVEETRNPEGGIEHPSVKNEKSDASFSGVLIILLAAMGCGAIIHGVILGVFYKWRQDEDVAKRSPFPLAAQPSTALPPEPRLEPLDRTEGVESSNVYLRLEKKEDVMRTYGKTPEEGYVHIPVGKAMDLLAGKLPARAAPPAEAQRRADGLTDSGESNSGRMFREGPRWWSER
jgi:hypothetical protein